MNMVPDISIIIPTLNSSQTLPLCLDSIAGQKYPKESLEFIFADGGSQDSTRDIIEAFKANYPDGRVILVENKLKTGEAGKARAIKEAKHQIIAFIDSDNILEEDTWLARMVEPFTDSEIIASEPLRYTYRRQDGYITRYCALMGMNDPLCYFLGNYDRECILSRRWTEMPIIDLQDNGNYLKFSLDPQQMPTIGANGFLIRRSELDVVHIGDYLFDIDMLAHILEKNRKKRIAKVRVGITHIYCGTIKDFFLKQKRRISDYKYFENRGQRRYKWKMLNRKGLFYFCLSSLTMLPLILQGIKGCIRKRDLCWFMHPVFCILTFYVYAFGTLSGSSITDRSYWGLKKS